MKISKIRITLKILTGSEDLDNLNIYVMENEDILYAIKREVLREGRMSTSESVDGKFGGQPIKAYDTFSESGIAHGATITVNLRPTATDEAGRRNVHIDPTKWAKEPKNIAWVIYFNEGATHIYKKHNILHVFKPLSLSSDEAIRAAQKEKDGENSFYALIKEHDDPSYGQQITPDITYFQVFADKDIEIEHARRLAEEMAKPPNTIWNKIWSPITGVLGTIIEG